MGVANMEIASVGVASMEVASSGSLIHWRAVQTVAFPSVSRVTRQWAGLVPTSGFPLMPLSVPVAKSKGNHA